jgi:hypothetical protein
VIVLQFEWDDDKAAENRRKHGVRLADAARVFADARALTETDHRSDYGEERSRTIGLVGVAVLYVVSTERGDAIRIISARRATHRERAQYDTRHHRS